MFRLISRLAAAALALAAATAMADAQVIYCPIPNATRMITDSLPADWWSTPIVSNLTETRITSIGGQIALQCIYGDSGSIQRYAPPNTNCTAGGAAFNCTPVMAFPIPFPFPPQPMPPPPPAGPVTYSTGTLSVPLTYLFDLDYGAVTATGADFWFQAQTPSQLFVTPQNGATIGVGNRSNRGYDGCSVTAMTTGSIPLGAIPAGSYVCVRTNEGRVSQFRVNSVFGSPATLTIGYTTWQ